MERKDNYKIQADQAKQHFLRYDQQKLIRKLGAEADENYIYVKFLCKQYRLNRTTGDISFRQGDTWRDGNSFAEVMTLLDLVCDSREDRFVSGRWKDLLAFGLMFHRSLLNEQDPWAAKFDADPEGLRRACLAMGGEKFPQGDVAYAIELFDGLKVVVQLLCWLHFTEVYHLELTSLKCPSFFLLWGTFLLCIFGLAKEFIWVFL